MQYQWRRGLALVLGILMVLAMLPGAAAERSGKLPEHVRSRDAAEGKAAPVETERTVVDTPLSVGNNTFTIEADETVYRPFTPSATAWYAITTTSAEDTYGYLLDADLNTLTYNDDGGENFNFRILYKLNADETYYIGVREYTGSYAGDITLNIKQYAENACGESLTWNYTSSTGKLTISGTGEMWDFEWGEAPWKEYVGEIKTISVGSGVTYIGDNAFVYCMNVDSVTLPDGLEVISDWAFERCVALETVTIPSSLCEIRCGAFNECDALSDVYYLGTPVMREDTLSIDDSYGYNDALLNATWHYYEESTDFDGTIEWNANDVQFRGTTPYVVANGSAQTPRFTVKDADGNVVDPSNYTYRYLENTDAGTGYVFVTFSNIYEGTARAWFKIYLPATKHTYVENTADGIRVTWDPVSGAAGYVIYRRAWNTQSVGWTEFTRWDNTTGTNYLDGHDDSHKVYAGTRYQYGIKAYFDRRIDRVTGATIGGNVGDNYNLGMVGPLKTTVRITTRDLTKLVAGSKKITAYWSPSKNFTGYQIQYATDAAFAQNANAAKIADPKASSKAISSLTNGTMYYVRVRSYHEFEGMTYFGGWSNVLSVKPGSGQTVTPDSISYRAICVGDNAYTSGANALDGCVNDMNSMKGMLEGLKNAFTVTKLQDGTSTQIVNAIKTLAGNAGDSDVSLFSFSGHGSTSGIYCVDGRTVTFSTLATELNKIPGRIIIILDCCQSGASIAKGKSFEDAFNAAAIEAFSGYWLDEPGTRSGELKKSKFIVITAAKSSEYSYDGGFDGSGYAQGAFTAGLIKAMGCTFPNGAYTGTTPADRNGDKNVTLKELYDAIVANVSAWGVPQSAQYYGTDSEVLFMR